MKAACKSPNKKTFQAFINKGLLLDNQEQCKLKDPVFVPNKKCSGKVVHCGKCGAFCSQVNFYRHRRACQKDDTTFPKPVKACLLQNDSEDSAFQSILSGIHDDEVGKTCKSDKFIKLVGKRLWDKDRAKPDKSMEVKKSVRASMRSLGKLYLEFKSVHPKESTDVSDLFDRENFADMRRAVRTMTDTEEGCGIKYGLKNNLYYLLLNAATIIKGSFLEQKGSEVKADEIDRFTTILKLNRLSMFGDATYNINRSRQERLRLPSRLPIEDDVEALRVYTVSTVKKLSDTYSHTSQSEFIKLRNAVCSRVTLFNARRGGEPARLKILQWQERKKWMPQHNSHGLSDQEKRLMSSMEITYQTGKGNHLVPCLVPRDCVQAMDKLCDPAIRSDAGILKGNEYIFASTGGSHDHVTGWDATHFTCKEADVNSSSINATNNRGRISTMYAALELPQEERAYFYAHMGHSADVNTGTYQRPLPVQEILKVGSHLQKFDKGKEKFIYVNETLNLWHSGAFCMNGKDIFLLITFSVYLNILVNYPIVFDSTVNFYVHTKCM